MCQQFPFWPLPPALVLAVGCNKTGACTLICDLYFMISAIMITIFTISGIQYDWISIRALHSGFCTREVVPRAAGPRREYRARRAEKNVIEGPCPGAEVPGLTQASLKHLKGKDPFAAALASVVSSLPPSKTASIGALEEMANVKLNVKASRKASTKRKGKETAMGPMLRMT